jgi:hypothetical protein
VFPGPYEIGKPRKLTRDVASTPSRTMIIGVISRRGTTPMWTGRSSDG